MRWLPNRHREDDCQSGGDYLLAVKGNQNTLFKAIQAAFAPHRQASPDKHQGTIEQHHGWVEVRSCHVFDATALIGEFTAWTGLRSIVMVESFRAPKRRSATLEYLYYISSQALTAEKAGLAIRAHWGIESMHWILDVSLQEAPARFTVKTRRKTWRVCDTWRSI